MIARVDLLVRIRSSGLRRCRCGITRRRYSTNGQKSVLQELDERGFVAAITSPKVHQVVQRPTTIYAGVDPSASSLHVGNLLPLLGLLHFQAKGHQSICLIGGATGSIGDPSGRSTERKALSPAELEHNLQGITAQVHRFFERGAAYISSRGGDRKGKGRVLQSEQGVAISVPGVKVLNNHDWTKGVTLLDFLRNVGKVARVGVMLSRESVKNRLNSESGISYTEFTYQLLQAFDFSHLHSTHGCEIQLGGSDQWGNIVAGIDLIKRLRASSSPGAGDETSGEEVVEGGETEGVDAYGLTIPLLTTSSGEKFGKSAGNAVWLDEARTSAAEFYQFFLRTTDEDVEKYLKLFTFLPLEEVESLIGSHKTSPSERTAQRRLAEEVTELVHGPKALRRAQTAATVLYSSSTADLTASDILSAFEGDNRLCRLTWGEVDSMDVSKLAVKIGLCSSRGEATRLTNSSAISVNSRKITDPRAKLCREELIDGQIAIFRVGTKRQIILHVSEMETGTA